MHRQFYAARTLAEGWILGLFVAGILLSAAGACCAADDAAKYVEALKQGDEKSRLAAIDALGRLGPAAKSATAALSAQLADKSPAVRSHAAYALMEIGPEAGAAADALAKATGDPDFHVRRMAIAAIEQIKPDPQTVVPALGKALEDEHPAVRIAALHTLTEYGQAALPVLSAALKNPATAYWAALALGELGPAAKGAVEGLAVAVDDKNPQIRREALLALARIGADAATAVPAITPHLEDPDASVRHAAGFALGSMGPAAAGAIGALQKEHDNDELEECIACWALARIEPDNKEAREHAITMLLASVKDKNPRVQSAALRGLADLKVAPEQMVPALGHVILNGEEPAASEALDALGAMSETAVPVISDALKNRPEVRGRAALLVTYLGPKAKAAVPGLQAALADDDATVRREVLFALAAIGAESAPAVAAIQKALDDPDTSNRATAAYALGRIGPPAAAALAKLQSELTSSDPLVRVASAYGLVFVAPGNERIVQLAVPVLVQGLQNPLAAARRGAAEALAHVGKPARPLAESALRTAARDPDETVRKAALEALERMGAVVDAPVSEASRR